jgi:acyl dehydratase
MNVERDTIEPSESELAALVGHRFPGGTYTVAHWENWLLTDCTGRSQLPDGIVHPIVLFHAPILGAGTSISELFRLGSASGQAGSVGLLGYDWEYMQPIREDVAYVVDGGIASAERIVSAAGVGDHVAFRIELSHDDEIVARVTNRWVFRRTTAPAAAGSPTPTSAPGMSTADADESIPTWDMPSVEAGRMRTMAAILRDPYPVHWDRSSNQRLGLGNRVINQGPLNLSYIANMLMEWAGPEAVRRLTVSFGRPVLDEDHVIARGRVRETVDGIARCDVWLTRGDETVVTGTAEVRSPST